MITVSRNHGNQPFYNMAEYLCDYQSDVASLPTNRGAGSRATVLENGNVYILNGQHQWILQSSSSGSGSGDSSLPSTDTTIVYDGGNLDAG